MYALVSYHRDERCVKALEYQQRKEPLDDSSGDRAAQNPFEVLKVLKKMTIHADVKKV